MDEEIVAQLNRIEGAIALLERKLDLMVDAIVASDDEETPQEDLEGNPVGALRRGGVL